MTAIGSSVAVYFDKVKISGSSRFNSTTMSVDASAASSLSLYWMHIAVDSPAFTATQVRLKNADLNIFTNQTSTNVATTLAMNGVIIVQPGSTIQMIATSNTLATYWSAFRIDNLFCPLVAFRVVRTIPVTLRVQITFDIILVNEGNAWNASTNEFIVPYDGIYLFSFSGGIRFQKAPYIELYVSETLVRRATGGLSQYFNSGVDILSKTCVLSLEAKDRVLVALNINNYLHSDPTNYQIAFTGFFYSLATKQQVSHIHHLLVLVVRPTSEISFCYNNNCHRLILLNKLISVTQHLC